MAHIFKCIQRRQRPQERHERRKYSRQPIDTERDLQIVCKPEQHMQLPVRICKCIKAKYSGEQHDPLGIEHPMCIPFPSDQRDRHREKNRQQNNCHKQGSIHMPTPFYMKYAARFRQKLISPFGNTPSSTATDASTTIGRSIRSGGSFFSSRAT